jgi:dihydroflavonol-4-reductase
MHIVTGATGIAGAHVVLELLRRGRNVTACKRPGADVRPVEALFEHYGGSQLFEKIRWQDIDLLDIFSLEDAFAGAEAVYHCAGLVSFSSRDRRELYRINEKGTANVVNTCLYLKIPALCHTSSLATLNNHRRGTRINEEVFWKRSGSESDYAISKYNAEREVWRGIEEGLKAVIVNPGVILAPGFWTRSSSRLFDTMNKGTMFYTPGSTAYVAATDVALAMVTLTEKQKFGDRYILAAGNYTFEEVFSRISSSLGKRPPFVRAGGFVLNAGYLAETALSWFGRQPVLTKALIRSALNTQQYDGSKVTNAIGIRYRNIPEVLDEICAAFAKSRHN